MAARLLHDIPRIPSRPPSSPSASVSSFSSRSPPNFFLRLSHPRTWLRSDPSPLFLAFYGVHISKRRKGSGLQNRPAIWMIKASPSAFLHRPLPPPTPLPLDSPLPPPLSLSESSSLPLHPAVAEEARDRESAAPCRERNAREPEPWYPSHIFATTITREKSWYEIEFLANFSIVVLVSYLASYSLCRLFHSTRINFFFFLFL